MKKLILIKVFIINLFLLLSWQAHAYRCVITGIKTNCWEDYNVTINVIDASNNKQLTSIIIPAGSLWNRQEFQCSAKQTLKYEASFNPVIWESEKDRIYKGLHFLTLPKEETEKEKVWNLKICFANQFGEVPLPPEAGQKCECDLTKIPAVEL